MKTLAYEALRIRSSGSSEKVNDDLVTEEGLAIYLNGEPLTVTMQTPGNELELTRGLLFTEGIYRDKSKGPEMKIAETNSAGHVTRIDVSVSSAAANAANKRSLLSVAACGICGKKELEFARGSLSNKNFLDISQLPILFEKMSEHQAAFQLSGGCHAAAAFSPKGELLAVMEDVGRHNAVDKVVGDLLMRGNLSNASFLLVSGRVSYEIVAKCFAAGIPVLAAVSAPSSLAVDFAKELGITLLGFCRGEKATIYAHPERI